jgi:DNA-binding transcriptional regulator YiaG
MRVFSGTRLRAARQAADVSRVALASAADVSYQSVRNWEAGVSVPKTNQLGVMSELLSVRIDDLFDEGR